MTDEAQAAAKAQERLKGDSTIPQGGGEGGKTGKPGGDGADTHG